MTLLSMTVQYSDPRKPPPAETILRLTGLTLKILRSVHKEIVKVQGTKYVAVDWRVRVFTFADRAIVEYEAPNGESSLERSIAEKAAGTKLPDMKGVA